jgi:sugar/nucleoside kinase (ribokinase family)
MNAESRTPKVACVGSYILDVLGRPIDALPHGQTTVMIDEIRITAAGTAGGTSVDLARLGADVIAIGAVGDDEVGDFLVALLERNGVATGYLRRKEGVPTSATILPIHPSGDRPAWHVRGANSIFEQADVPWEAVATCDFVHLGGVSALPRFDGQPSLEVLRYAKRRGITTTADCLGVKRDDTLEILRPCLPYVDIFMPNMNEALRITGRAAVADAARMFLDLGARCVIVKMGADGCFIADESERERIPAFDVTPVDSTGCGDAFCAGVILGTWLGWDISRCAELGSAAAALTLGGLGSDAGIRNLADTVEFMKKGRCRRTDGQEIVLKGPA